ncbi:LysR family transcriptional regulator [Alphaproteobacteria bacterium GH1-50]|uniref:LysR family transcriptional regulator n=1 Tax=Kangsaoukella pontilimi TaxID=2691042 RepID=A0A7C9II29_9RHOB|nr:LysR family transcriptional regulator [Kangsaoukella pontilimi]MXQ08102.1 LysR family transcriptional regulator [Kangsaoukella pontilimi]
MNLNALRVFTVVAEHGNLQRAADRLNLSRGAVSQRIKQLEVDLGTVLLERGARGVALTEDGERCRAAMVEALSLIETALSGIGDKDGTITIHLGSSTATKWLMPRMDRFRAEFPDVALTTEIHETRLRRSLGPNELAIWPGSAPDGNPAHLSCVLTEIRLVAVCAPSLARPAGTLDTAALLALPFLQDANRHWDRLVEESGAKKQAKPLNVDRSALALDAAINGHGVAIAPAYMVEADIARGRLSEIWSDPEPPRQQLYLSWSREDLGHRTAGKVVDWIRAGFGHPCE